MLTFVLRDKSLTCNQSSQIYQYDNNADQIKCLVPCMYDGICLKDSTVTMFYKDELGNGGFIELINSDELHNKDYHQFFNRINSAITQTAGKIIVWLKINDCENNLSFETSETSFNILPSKEIPKTTASQQQSYFDQWLIKMTQIQNSTLKLQRDIVNQGNASRVEIEKLKQEIVTLKGGVVDGN